APPPIAERTPGVSVTPALEALVMKLLEKDPKNRYQSAAELIAALDSVMMATNFEVGPEVVPQARSREPPPPEPALSRAFLRRPGASLFDRLVPREGRFPRWAYLALPLVALFILISLTLLALRPSRSLPSERASTESLGSAPVADPTASAEPREVAVEV